MPPTTHPTRLAIILAVSALCGPPPVLMTPVFPRPPHLHENISNNNTTTTTAAIALTTTSIPETSSISNLTSTSVPTVSDISHLDYIDLEHGGPDCITAHDNLCECCKWKHPAQPAACRKLKCCPCIKHYVDCDAKDLACWERKKQGPGMAEEQRERMLEEKKEKERKKKEKERQE